MITNYSVGDFLIRIKNAAIAKKKYVVAIKSNEIEMVAKCLKKMGYLDDVVDEKEKIKVQLSFKNKRPIVTNIKLVSKPGRRVYIKVVDLLNKRGPSFYILSTPKGIISSQEAKKLGVGGEVLAEIW